MLLLSISSGQGEFYYQLGSQLLESFNFMSAVELLRLAQSNEGNSARILLAAGASCLNHDPLAAEPVVLLRQAIARDPGSHKAYYLLGRAYTRQGKLAAAIVAYRKAAELHPGCLLLCRSWQGIAKPARFNRCVRTGLEN